MRLIRKSVKLYNANSISTKYIDFLSQVTSASNTVVHSINFMQDRYIIFRTCFNEQLYV